jgi:hypothetical protein
MLGRGGAPGVINGALPSGSDPTGATFQLSNNGTYFVTNGGSGNWVTPANATIAAYYQCKVDVTAGAFSGPSSATGSWLDLSTTRSWAQNAGGSAVFTLSIREKATTIVRSVQTGIVLDAS